MTPAILLDREGRFVGAIGSPGGNAILAYVGKALVGVLDWGLPMQAGDRPAQPHRARRQLTTARSTNSRPAWSRRLRARGIEVRPGQGEDSGLHGVHAARTAGSTAAPIRAARACSGSSRRPRRVPTASATVAKPSRASSRFSSRLISSAEARPAIDQRGVELDEARPGADPLEGVGAAGDPARRDQRQCAAASPPGNRAAAAAPAPSAARRTGRPPRLDAASGAPAG